VLKDPIGGVTVWKMRWAHRLDRLGWRWAMAKVVRSVWRPVKNEPFVLMWVAQMLARAGRVEEAALAFCQADGLGRDSLKPYEELGVELFGDGRMDEGLEFLREAVRRGTTHAEARELYLHGSVAALTEAEARLLRKRLRGGPVAEAKEAALKREWAELLEIARGVVWARRDSATGHVLLGMCLSHLGRSEEAAAAYRRVMELDGGEDVRALLERELSLAAQET